ncbi:MAG: insulinase family protein [Roseovarius sp.]|nr:insulinase family protein [Roseovarius sp.]
MSVNLTTLPNGFRIVTEHMPGLQSAAVGVWVLAGARHETAAENGIAHFLEHMAFKGTARRSALQIAETIEDVGGYINAYTSREVTAFYARVLQGDVPLALDVLADILRAPAFDPREIEIERGVILQEIGQVLDTPDDIIFDWLQERAYPDHPLGRTILGEAAGGGQDHLRRAVVPVDERGQVVAGKAPHAGAVDHDALVRDAERFFGDMASGTTRTAPGARFAGGESRHVKQLEQAHFALAFESPDYTDPRIHAAQIYANALGGSMSSRLFQEIRERRGLCYTIYAQAGAYCDTGMMTIYAGTSAAQMPDLAQITIDEMKRAAGDISLAELERGRAQMKAGLLMGLESPSSRAERLARMLQIWGRVPPLDEVVEKIDAVTLTDLRGIAERTIATAPAAMALYGPVDAAPTLAALQERRAA